MLLKPPASVFVALTVLRQLWLSQGLVGRGYSIHRSRNAASTAITMTTARSASYLFLHCSSSPSYPHGASLGCFYYRNMPPSTRALHKLHLRRASASSTSARPMMISVAESDWRAAAERHRSRVRELLDPGLMREHGRGESTSSAAAASDTSRLPLDPRHPVYNFLVEYYGVKGAKGPRRLGLWTPEYGNVSSALAASAACREDGANALRDTGVFLVGATEQDLGETLHRRGATVVPPSSSSAGAGIAYRPFQYFLEKKERMLQDEMNKGPGLSTGVPARIIGPYLWYLRLLERTLAADPVLYCYGLHEWAMQYWPKGAPPPPSAKYQSHLPLRIDRQAINAVVEGRDGQTRLSCTHYDALRFFAPAAVPLNSIATGIVSSESLTRGDQLRIEQPACVHAQMDLLKVALKLVPLGGSPTLVVRALELALEARRLDVAASPYDATAYGVDPVCVETAEGRNRYRQEQVKLTVRARSLREDLVEAYRAFLRLAFTPEDVVEATAAFERTWQTNQERRPLNQPPSRRRAAFSP